MSGEPIRRLHAGHSPTSVDVGSSLGQAIHFIEARPEQRAEFREIAGTVGWPIAYYNSVEEFLHTSGATARGCIVAELFMPGMGGLQLLQALRESRLLCPPPLIVATTYGTVPLASEAMRAGALHVIEFPLQGDLVTSVLREAMQVDQRNYTETMQIKAIRQRLDSLTDRERSVLRLVLAGMPNKTIARRLGVSQRTIEFRRHDIYAKTGAESIVPLIQMVMRANWDGIEPLRPEELEDADAVQ